MEEETQAQRINGVQYEVGRAATALKSLAKGIWGAVYDLLEHSRLPAIREITPNLCDDIEQRAKTIDGYCLLIDHMADHLDEVSEETEKIWSEMTREDAIDKVASK